MRTKRLLGRLTDAQANLSHFLGVQIFCWYSIALAHISKTNQMGQYNKGMLSKTL